MSTTNYSPLISKIYKSRNIILEILKYRGFNVDDWTNFSITEIQSMFNNKELDILVKNPTTNKKLYVKYHLSGSKSGTSMSRLGSSHIYDYVDDLFDIEEELETTETFDPFSSSALPLTPMPNQQVVQTAAAMPAAGAMNQGLTPTENALYSEEEKQITLRNRGLA